MEEEEERERDREENLLDSRAVAYTKAFREVHPTGANSRGWAKAFLERKSSRCEKSVAKIEPRRRTALSTLLSIVSFFFSTPFSFSSRHPEASIDLLRNYLRSNNSYAPLPSGSRV